MKKIILGLAAVASLVACNENESPQKKADILKPTPLLSPVADLEEGGISSGGGGTLPADPASVWQIESYIKDAKRDLRLYFRYRKLQAQEDENPYDLEKKLYLGAFSVLEALEKTDLELLMDKPCLDGNQKEVDGSIHASRPNTICISAFKIAPKLPEELARREVLALIGHEISHLVGANEAEATEFQKDIIFDFKYSKVEDKTSFYFVDDAYSALTEVRDALDEVIKNFQKSSDEELSIKTSKVQSKIDSYILKSYWHPFSLYLKPQYDYLNIQGDRFRMGLWYSLSLVSGNGDYWHDELDKLFGQDGELSPEEFQRRRYPNLIRDKIGWPKETIKRIQSRSELLNLLIGMKSYFDDQRRYVWAFTYSAPLLKLLVGPWVQPTENPWKKFIGEYRIIDRQCKADGFQSDSKDWIVGLMIHYPDNDNTQLRFREIDDSGWADSGLEDNSSVISSGTVSVEGNENSASRIAEDGQTWAGRWSKRVDTFENTSEGLVWKLRIDNKSEYTNKRAYLDCTMKLQKK